MNQGQFVVMVADGGQHEMEELEEACRQLRDDLMHVDDIDLFEVQGEAPEPGTRSAAVTVSTAILVAVYGGKLAVMGAQDLKKLKDVVVPAVARVFSLWLRRNRDTRAIIRLANGTEADLTNLSEDEIRSILEQVTEREQGPDKSVSRHA